MNKEYRSVRDYQQDKALDELNFINNPVGHVIAKQEMDLELTPEEKDFMWGCFKHEHLYLGGGELGVRDNIAVVQGPVNEPVVKKAAPEIGSIMVNKAFTGNRIAYLNLIEEGNNQ